MTVCVAVKVHDCLVFAADSASTLTATDGDGNQTVLNVYNNADKVFNLHRGLPLVAMTCGMGHIGGRSISSLAKEFRHGLNQRDFGFDPASYTVESVTRSAHEFFKGKYEDAFSVPDANHYLEFWVGGYGSSNSHGEIWRISLIDGAMHEPVQLNKEDQPQAIFWGGQGEAISRLLIGVDPRFEDVLQEANVPKELAGQVGLIARQGLEKPVLSATMPVIDTIRLADFLVQTTIGYFSFAFGSDIVGGAVDLATVTKFEGFKWVKRKHYYPSELNRNDTDHLC